MIIHSIVPLASSTESIISQSTNSLCACLFFVGEPARCCYYCAASLCQSKLSYEWCLLCGAGPCALALPSQVFLWLREAVCIMRSHARMCVSRLHNTYLHRGFELQCFHLLLCSFHTRFKAPHKYRHPMCIISTYSGCYY